MSRNTEKVPGQAGLRERMLELSSKLRRWSKGWQEDRPYEDCHPDENGGENHAHDCCCGVYDECADLLDAALAAHPEAPPLISSEPLQERKLVRRSCDRILAAREATPSAQREPRLTAEDVREAWIKIGAGPGANAFGWYTLLANALNDRLRALSAKEPR